ncbi:MAG: hypothetical protein JO257_00370 [Deltaproteobacteria bacterium]|nr:hypothetical protein [Deltaproteobacteria bacterium]
MKRVLAAVVLAGCASGSAAKQQQDAPNGQADAKVFLDGNIEGHPDAPADAAPHIDAPPDARPDARPIDAAPPDACVPQTTELLQNPVFDLTPVGTGWNETPIDPTYPPITSDGFAAQTAPYKAWMGGFDGQSKSMNSVTDVVWQDFVVPPGTTALVLTGYYVVGTNETSTTTVYDTASVDLLQTNGTPIENVMAPTNLTVTGSTWTAFSHTFTHLPAGQTVRLRFTSTNDITNVTNFFFDTLSLKATHCP